MNKKPLLSLDSRSRTWDIDNIDWTQYELHRPPYPPALFDLIYAHHDTHGSGLYSNALDVGAGGGTVTGVLLQRFDHVTWSDASEGYLSQAQKRFTQAAEEKKINFLHRKFDAFDPATDGTYDLLTAGTCVHFSEPELITSQLAPVLRPGGTLAFFTYGAIPIGPPDHPASPMIAAAKEKIIAYIRDNIAKGLENNKGPGTAQARYDNIPFDPSTWSNVRRITNLPVAPNWPSWINAMPSQVREDVESKEVLEDEGMMEREVGFEWFPVFYENFAPRVLDYDALIGEDMQKLKEVLKEEKIKVRWPVILVLATRKGD